MTRPIVLAVDDETEILIAIEDLLGDDYRVLTASSPKAALDLLAQEADVSVIISDQRMPEMTGDAFLAAARDLTRAEAILLTGYADLSAVIAAVNRGRVIGYVHKPWDPDLLRGMVASARERYRVARELDTERTLLHGLLDSVDGAVSFKDRQGCFVRLNGAKAMALGQTVAGCLGRREVEFLDAEAAAVLEQAERVVVAKGHAVEDTEARRRGSGPDEQWVTVTRIPIKGAAEDDGFLVTIERDVTEQRRLEDHLRQTEKLQALGTLAGGIAHDFNNVLMAVLGSLELALRHDLGNPRLQRYLENADLAAKRGAALTERLLSFSRRKGRATEVVDLNQTIGAMEGLVASTLGGMVSVRNVLAEGLWSTVVEPDQIELAVLNLCINARDAMPDGGLITIETRNQTIPAGEPDLMPGDYAVVSVADTGSGIRPEVMQRIFEPFFTTKGNKGTGLGLSMALALARRLGGAIRVDSALGQGTRVDLYLPRIDGKVTRRDGTAATFIERAGEAARILLVDDDKNVREVTAAYLNNLGHAATEASDGKMALELFQDGAGFDLVIADIAMPGMTGFDLAREVRKLRPEVPILLVTGHADVTEAPQATAVLMKPFGQSDLAVRIASLIEA